jgi:Fe-S cluster assembly scaffold protein SufB
VRLISEKKGEPEWLLEFRLKAFHYWQTQEQPTWGHLQIPPIDYQAISYYADPTAAKKKEGPKSLEDIDPELMKKEKICRKRRTFAAANFKNKGSWIPTTAQKTTIRVMPMSTV